MHPTYKLIQTTKLYFKQEMQHFVSWREKHSHTIHMFCLLYYNTKIKRYWCNSIHIQFTRVYLLSWQTFLQLSLTQIFSLHTLDFGFLKKCFRVSSNLDLASTFSYSLSALFSFSSSRWDWESSFQCPNIDIEMNLSMELNSK